MREIKFRGKRIDNGEWVYGDICHHDGVISHIGQSEYDGSATVIDLDPETVGQYAGLKNANGKEIYEGDIVADPCYPEWRTAVIFAGTSFQFEREHPAEMSLGELSAINRTEVIGNIHENPELLEAPL